MTTDFDVHAGRFVWIFARPLFRESIFSSFAGAKSNGKFHLCHWGVLVTPSAMDVKELRQGTDLNTELGVMWELLPANHQNHVYKYQPFKASNLREEWRIFSAEYTGMTALMDEQIDQEGTWTALESLGG